MTVSVSHCNTIIPPAMLPTGTCTHEWETTREKLYFGIWKTTRSLVPDVRFTLPIGCRNGRDPEVILRVVPCKNGQSRHISIEGELLIRRGCSRFKWLVEYCRCSIVLSVRVIYLLNNINELSSTEEEFEIVNNNLNRDHCTTLKLTNVLDHHYIFYGTSITKFAFQATLELFEHGVRQSDMDLDLTYECKDSEEYAGFTAVVPKSEAS